MTDKPNPSSFPREAEERWMIRKPKCWSRSGDPTHEHLQKETTSDRPMGHRNADGEESLGELGSAGGKGWAVGAKHRDEPANRIVDEAEIELELP